MFAQFLSKVQPLPHHVVAVFILPNGKQKLNGLTGVILLLGRVLFWSVCLLANVVKPTR